MPAGGGPSAWRRPLAAPERRRKVEGRPEESRFTPRDSRLLPAEPPRSSAGVDASGSAVASSTQAAAKPVATQRARKSWESEQLPLGIVVPRTSLLRATVAGSPRALSWENEGENKPPPPRIRCAHTRPASRSLRQHDTNRHRHGAEPRYDGFGFLRPGCAVLFRARRWRTAAASFWRMAEVALQSMHGSVTLMP